MMTGSISDLLNEYISSKDESLLSQLSTMISARNDEDLSLRSSKRDQCENEFGENLWGYLDDSTQELIISAFAEIDFQKKNNLNAAPSFSSIASSLESELKNKIFISFNELVRKKINAYKGQYDQKYIEALTSEEGFVPASQMINKLKYMKNPKGISKDLRSFLENEWDIDNLSDDSNIEDAFSLIEIRNENAHGVTNKNYGEWANIKKLVIRVLRWFIFSCDYFS